MLMTAPSLRTTISLSAVRKIRLRVAAVAAARSVGLPDIDTRVGHRAPRTGEHATADIDELALCLGGAAAWAREIGGQIGALRDGIERADDLRRRDRKCSSFSGARPGFGPLIHWGSLISASLMILAQWATSVRIPSPNSA